MRRRRVLLLLALGLAVSASGAWLWPIGLVAQRLGPFSFRAPRAATIEPGARSERLEVRLVTERPAPVTEVGTIAVDGFEGWIQRTAAFAPVAGYDRWATDIRDRGILLWFPSLQHGLHVHWRTFGGGYWMRDTRLTRSASALVASLRIDV